MARDIPQSAGGRSAEGRSRGLAGRIGALRTGWRLRRRSRKKLARLAEADLVLVSYPKSGRTWLITMISHVLHRRFGVPETQLVNFDNFHRLDSRIPRIFYTADNMKGRPSTDEEVGTLYAGKKILLLLRDPRDVAVSLYFHFTRRSTPLERAVFGVPENIADIPLARFLFDEAIGLPQVIAFENAWMRRLQAFPDSLLVTFEGLRADPLPELARIIAFLGIAAGEEDIAAAVDFASFSRMKERERSNFFETDRLRPGNAEDPDSFKVRRGRVGGWRDYFDEETIAAIDRMLADRLTPALPYGREERPPARAQR